MSRPATKNGPQLSDEQRAKEYLDKVAAINEAHGMGTVNRERYDHAVRDAARLFRRLHRETGTE